MSNQEDNKPLSPLARLGIFIISVFLVSVVILWWDGTANNSMIWNEFRYGSDCDYETPEGYTIYYSSEENLYAVKVNRFGDLYLWNGKSGISEMFSNIAEPSLFIDSCGAKAFLKAYIEQHNG